VLDIGDEDILSFTAFHLGAVRAGLVERADWTGHVVDLIVLGMPPGAWEESDTRSPLAG
jgi:hypothetical protein